MCRLFIALALLLCSLAEAAPHRLRVHPNQSLTIFSMAEGPDGLLWLAAADGLYRFNGFHYDKITAYPFVSAHSVGFTRDGSLWCAGVEGLARVVDHRFEIVTHELVQSMAIYPDQVFVRLGDGLARVGLDGSVKRLKYLIRRDLTIDSAGRLWGVCLYRQTPAGSIPQSPMHRRLTLAHRALSTYSICRPDWTMCKSCPWRMDACGRPPPTARCWSRMGARFFITIVSRARKSLARVPSSKGAMDSCGSWPSACRV